MYEKSKIYIVNIKSSHVKRDSAFNAVDKEIDF